MGVAHPPRDVVVVRPASQSMRSQEFLREMSRPARPLDFERCESTPGPAALLPGARAEDRYLFSPVRTAYNHSHLVSEKKLCSEPIKSVIDSDNSADHRLKITHFAE